MPVHNNALAVSFALLSAVTIAVGTVWRHHILRAGLHHTEANSSPLGAMRRPQWWLSILLAFVAYGLQAVALAFGSLLVVQPILVLSLMFTLVLAARVERRPMEPAETLWAFVLTACVGVVVVLGRPLPGERLAPAWEWAAAIGAGVVACATIFALAYRRSPAAQALLYGIVCGAVFGYLAVFSKVAVDAFAAGGLPAMLSTWQFWAMVVSSLFGTVVQQYAFGAGVLSRSLPAMKIVEPLIALFLGLSILGEYLQVESVFGWLVMGASIGGMLVATGMLARKPVA
ncbi:DMT family transporter [Corynebacterium sanguinis]|uniref:DMT family transporter n=1 Tax=Corynebacterium sanguinis TaxID=2594913 RepID=UPI00223C26B8|nr:DMT family transporter [Corynebacterium sanguinis]MCT2023820.1 DMT family transporter [Corynebacterium sanguinis]MCT2158605.1 DMT family transporter [Corynebacterium sanguinis]